MESLFSCWEKAQAAQLSFHFIEVPPTHLSHIPSEAHGNYVYNAQFDASVRAQQASELWRGFPKNDQTDFNEARAARRERRLKKRLGCEVHMCHIMRK